MEPPAAVGTGTGGRLRAAEVIGTLCLATDLGMGFPFEHGALTTVIAMRLAACLGVDRETAVQVYYASLLSHAGCTADVHVAAEVFGGSLTEHLNPLMYGSGRDILTGLVRALPDPDASGLARTAQIARRFPRMTRETRPALVANCEVAGMLADRVGAPTAVPGLLAYLTERWDGKSPLRRASGEAIPVAMRIVHVAVDVAFQLQIGGTDFARRVIGDRAGRAFDPWVAVAVTDASSEILKVEEGSSVWREALAAEPEPWLSLDGKQLDLAVAAMGRFADLVSPYHSGHSAGVAELAGAAAQRCGLDPGGVRTVQRAGHVHDLGRVAVDAATWGKAGPLNADEWERVRLHPYHTERVLSRSATLAALAPVAGAHHERLDRSGYHRGSPAADLPLPARILAAADLFHAKLEPRPYRPALTRAEAAQTVLAEARSGRLDPDAAAAVVEAAGERSPRVMHPCDLTDREIQVVGLLARGLQTKQVARRLGISVKTADSHIQNAYGKIGVSSRAAATLFAVEHGLLAWGEFPIPGQQVRT
ncbi:HD domain-containing phosphohydrolase [Promicromonospora sp. NPDC057138]|uniref:HD domain-containing phosphohydrolase n=1 Tax=Promicromonospora sp. NPDC057138 TaxID=3346031 RepID=UPI00362AFC6D